MVLEVNSSQTVFSGRPQFLVNPNRVDAFPKYVTSSSASDSVNVNMDLSRYLNEQAISEMISVNSDIRQICNGLHIPVKINMAILHELVQNHLPQTKATAIGIVNNLPQNMKVGVDIQALQKAAVLHDIGKVLIPEGVVSKPGALNEKERDIMQQHAILSYELLKNSDLDEETLYLVRNHHQNAQRTGYPSVDQSFVADINLQILSVADIYSALREKRAYKPAFSKDRALSIIHGQMKQGKVHPYVFKALVDYANKEESKSTKFNPQRNVFYLKPSQSLSA